MATHCADNGGRYSLCTRDIVDGGIFNLFLYNLKNVVCRQFGTHYQVSFELC